MNDNNKRGALVALISEVNLHWIIYQSYWHETLLKKITLRQIQTDLVNNITFILVENILKYDMWGFLQDTDREPLYL